MKKIHELPVYIRTCGQHGQICIGAVSIFSQIPQHTRPFWLQTSFVQLGLVQVGWGIVDTLDAPARSRNTQLYCHNPKKTKQDAFIALHKSVTN